MDGGWYIGFDGGGVLLWYGRGGCRYGMFWVIDKDFSCFQQQD